MDVYNRHLAYVVTEDGTCVNVVLVREGLARISARLPLTRLAELRRAEGEAQAFRRGMWGSAAEMPMTGYTRRSGSGRSGATMAPASPKTKPRQTTATTKPRRSKKSKGV